MMTRTLLLGLGILAYVFFGSAEGAEGLTSGSGGSQEEQAELPAHLRWARRNPDRRPPPGARREVRPEDKRWLMREYRRQSKPSQRVASTWLLAYVGDDEVFRLFSEALRLGPGSRRIDGSEWGGVRALLHGMGVMAQTNDQAFQFLVGAINPDWWRKERKWREISEAPGRNAVLASVAVQVLGLSARSEAGVILDRMKKEGCNYVSPKDPREHRNLNTDAYTAKLYLEVSRKMGRDAFRYGLFGGEFERLSKEWKRSEQGLNWLEWCCPKDRWPDMWEDISAYFERTERTVE